MHIELRPDCARCRGLCCIVPSFQRSADFGEDKASGVACLHLSDQHRCQIHHNLRESGYAGCAAFDCYGAGQALSRANAAEVTPRLLFSMRSHHQVLWLLGKALSYSPSRRRIEELAAAEAEVRERIATRDIEPVPRAMDVLRRVSDEIRGRRVGPGRSLAGADLVGGDLRSMDLRASSLRGALLLGARLDGVDLAGADLTGADLRGSRLHGADLSASLFLHGSQVESALGNAETRLPPDVSSPAHWGTPATRRSERT